MTEPHRIGARLEAAYRTRELDWLLDDMATRIREIRHAVVLSDDGLTVGTTDGLTRHDAEHLAAVAAGFHSLAAGTGRRFRAGDVHRTMVEMDGGLLFVAAAGDGSCLAVLTTVGADVGMVAYEMARLIKRVGEHLATPARRADPAHRAAPHPPAAG
ncbi:roadblock/LC7 domain-containing protein [Streptomyces sp. bgisy100]|uniref:roadblock/LC7 domain-containing protein n=1 Tax=Streptomyces sp. bgisy100 TaxID=3413783 RepID=UPI003D754273